MISEPMAVTGQVAELLRHVDDARQSRHRECVRLLLELTPQLQEAVAADRERERRQAPRFNVFKYLREDELGLSRIIADLLDPMAEHGQGTSFLEAMLDAMPETRGRFGKRRLTARTSSPIRVRTERRTTAGRFIDITVDIPEAGGRFCLAFENKPYAHDLDDQLKDYLEYLGAPDRYGERFLLVYLPPVHRQPAEAALPKVDRERWRKHFTIMPYTGGDPSLDDWFATCRSVCGADAVSWFLRHAESFCQQRFGESTMTTNPDARFVREYLSDNPSHMRAALAVHDGWRLVRSEACERFLEHLRRTVEDQLQTVLEGPEDDFHVTCHYRGGKRSELAIYRDAWIRYDEVPSTMLGRSAVALQSVRQGPKGWYWGVRSPKALGQMTETEKERREELATTLGRSGLSLADDGDWWPQWEYLPRYRNWHPLAPELYEECEAGGGPITTYLADRLLKIAEHAIPAINKVEMVNRASSDA